MKLLTIITTLAVSSLQIKWDQIDVSSTARGVFNTK
jgi:hypothetical protein